MEILPERDLLLPSNSGEDNAPRYNVLHARVGRWHAYLQWLPLPEQKKGKALIGTEGSPPPRRRRVVFPLLVVSFVLGAIAALGVTWELIPYVEATRVFGELARLKLSGALCLDRKSVV